MNCSWTNAVRLAGWDFARSDSDRVLAFVYTATVSLRVEESCVSINPDLSLNELEQVLTRAPAWVAGRPDWLKTDWPRQKIDCRSDLELYGLTSAKALLAVGSRISDGTANKMANAFAGLFPQVSNKFRNDEESYEAWKAYVTIETDGNMQWGYGGPLVRAGLSWPLSEVKAGDRSAFELFLQNQLRIDIQRRIELDAI